MPRYTFPGFFPFLKEAARQIGHPEAEGPARRIAALGALANLCAQAGEAAPEDVPAITAKAEEFRDQLHAALVAARLMLKALEESSPPTGKEIQDGSKPRTTRGPRQPEGKTGVPS